MAEPVSLAASIVTLVTVVNFAMRTVHSMANGPEELRQLHSELEQIQVIADELNRLKDDTVRGFVTAKHVEETRAIVKELQKVLEKCKKGSDNWKVKPWTWIARRNKIVRLGTELRSIQAKLLADTHIITLRGMINLATAFEMSERGFIASTAMTIPKNSTGASTSSRSGLNEDQQRFCCHLQTLEQNVGLQNISYGQISYLSKMAAKVAECDEDSNSMTTLLPSTSFRCKTISGYQSPMTSLESSSTFYGEAYTVENAYGSSFFVSFCTSTLRDNRRVVVYTVDFAVDSRHRIWTTIVIDAPMDYDHGLLHLVPDGNNSAMIQADVEITSKLENAVRQNEILRNGSEFFFSLQDGIEKNDLSLSGLVRLAAPESGRTHRERLLSLVRHLGCTLVPEKQIEFVERRYSNIFDVMVHSQRYIYRQIQPQFLRNANFVSKLEAQIKSLHLLKNSTAILGLRAVVVDDSQRYFKGYLIRWVGGNSCTSASEWMAHGNVSWIRRQTWARCYVQALSELHSVGHVVGRVRHGHIFGNLLINDQDVPSLLLRALDESIPENLMDQRGTLAPEIRLALKQNNSSTAFDCSFEIDLFNLGMMLWSIGSQYPVVIGPCFCLSVECPSRPRSECTAEHTNPVTLPPCPDRDVPAWYQGIIAFCRNHNPGLRKPAKELLRIFPPEEEEMQQLSASLTNLATDAPNFAVGYLIVCSECVRSVAHSGGYHCEICKGGDFDLCMECASEGIHCYDSTHVLFWQEKVNYSMVRNARHPPLLCRNLLEILD